ncbi:hypothetical protein HYQ46_000929 [Verticillium longisporum]|nr:hypothetical protein HYQ46_000929 [Verticillium longisporum]
MYENQAVQSPSEASRAGNAGWRACRQGRHFSDLHLMHAPVDRITAGPALSSSVPRSPPYTWGTRGPGAWQPRRGSRIGSSATTSRDRSAT